MTLIEQVQILGDKIKAKKAQYDLDREAARYLHYLLKIWRNMNI